MLVVEVPPDLMPSNVQTSKVVSIQGEVLAGSGSYSSVTYVEMENETGKDVNLVRIDISFKSPSHTGLQTTQLVCIFLELFIILSYSLLHLWCPRLLDTELLNYYLHEPKVLGKHKLFSYGWVWMYLSLYFHLPASWTSPMEFSCCLFILILRTLEAYYHNSDVRSSFLSQKLCHDVGYLVSQYVIIFITKLICLV